MAKIKKDRMGSMSGMKASDKRVGPVDPQGAMPQFPGLNVIFFTVF